MQKCESVDAFLDSVLSEGTPLAGSTVASSSSDISFRRGRELGRGGCGTVYQAVLADGRLAAVKELPLSDQRGVDKELFVMCNLPPHPHCVRYLGSRRSQHHINLVMEYVSGGSIQSLRQAIGKFSEAVVWRYARMTLLGLQHLHEHRLIHQDIKGANVLLDEQGNAKIADFGCIRDMTGQALTIAAGTPLWMAPEVCRGGASSTKSDVWSFGCLLLEMTNDSGYPWTFPQGTSIQGVAYAIGSARTPPPFPEGLSHQLQDFMRCCLCLEPSRRSSVAELLQHSFMISGGTQRLEDECWTLSRRFSALSSHHAPPKKQTDSVFVLDHASSDDDEGTMLQKVKLPQPPPPAQQQQQHQQLVPKGSFNSSETLSGKELVWLTRGEASVERRKKHKEGKPSKQRDPTQPEQQQIHHHHHHRDSREGEGGKRSLVDKLKCLAFV